VLVEFGHGVAEEVGDPQVSAVVCDSCGRLLTGNVPASGPSAFSSVTSFDAALTTHRCGAVEGDRCRCTADLEGPRLGGSWYQRSVPISLGDKPPPRRPARRVLGGPAGPRGSCWPR
jgi:hypothetical protein